MNNIETDEFSDFVKSEMEQLDKSIDRPPTEEKMAEIDEMWRKMCNEEWDGPETPYVKFVRENYKNRYCSETN